MNTPSSLEAVLSNVTKEQKDAILRVLSQKRQRNDSESESFVVPQTRPWRTCDNCQLASIAQSQDDPYLLLQACPSYPKRVFDREKKRVECGSWRQRSNATNSLDISTEDD